MELTTMLPVAVMGPVMGHDVSGANHLIATMLDGRMPAFPNLFIPIVDVRDVAAAHVLAMQASEAAGERFLLSNGPAIAMQEIGATIRAELGEAAKQGPTHSIPDLVVRLGAPFSRRFRAIAPDLGYAKNRQREGPSRARLGASRSSRSDRFRREEHRHEALRPGTAPHTLADHPSKRLKSSFPPRERGMLRGTRAEDAGSVAA